MNRYFFYISLFYVVLNIFYSFYLKKIVILDVLIIAIGFVLRVMIGGVVIKSVELSPWILIITFILTTFLGLMKRRQELIRVNKLKKDNKVVETRKSLKDYNLSLLDQLISITMATTLISYITYVLDSKIQTKFHTDKLYFTIPFVVFGIFRYLYLSLVMDKGESPEEILFSDIPFAVNIILWVLSFVGIIYYKI
jgi:4-hydroxybenzoate polyprenyltransferase